MSGEGVTTDYGVGKETCPCGALHGGNGRYLIASCEFSNELIKVDVAARTVLGKLRLPRRRGQPQDVRLSPDGRVFYVADMRAHGVYLIDGEHLSGGTPRHSP